MSVSMGMNVKVVANRAARSEVREMFEALGVNNVESPAEHIDIFTLGDGGHWGFFYGPTSDVLTTEQLANSVWLELRVSDIESGIRALDQLEIPRVEYMDKAHVYFRAPGGLVFRLAALG